MRYPFIWTLSFPGMFGGLWTLSLSSLVTEGGGGRGAKLGGGAILGIWSNGLRVLTLRILCSLKCNELSASCEPRALDVVMFACWLRGGGCVCVCV